MIKISQLARWIELLSWNAHFGGEIVLLSEDLAQKITRFPLLSVSCVGPTRDSPDFQPFSALQRTAGIGA